MVLLSEYKKRKSFKRFLKNETNINLKDSINNLNLNTTSTIRIFGNAKSLEDISLEYNSMLDTMVVNMFVLNENYTKLKPKYYVTVDIRFGRKDMPAFNVVKQIVAETTWEMHYFAPYSTKSKEFDEIFESNPKITLHYFNTTEYFGHENYRHYCYDHNLAIPAVENVIIACIYLAIYLNYNCVELYGVENKLISNLWVNEQNQVHLKYSYCYTSDTFPTVVNLNRTMHSVLKEQYKIFSSYWELKDIAERKRIKIFNCTKDSFIDAFDRK